MAKRWGGNGNSDRFYFLGLQNHCEWWNCSHEIKRHLLLVIKAMTNLDSMLKCRDITLPTKVCLVKAMAFPVVMYGCESWTVKKAEHQRIDAFELWCWRKFLRLPWTSKGIKLVNLKGNQPWIFIGRTGAEAPILWPPDTNTWLIGKYPDAGKDWKQKEMGGSRGDLIASLSNSMDMNLSKPQEIVKDRGAWRATVHRFTESDRLHNCTPSV